MKISSIHNYAKNPFLLALMIVSIIGSSFMSLQAVTSNNNNISADELFNAVYFLEGDLVNKIPTLKNISSYTKGEKTASELNIQRQLSREVDKIDSSFKSRLLRAVNSRDQYTISDVIKEGGDLILLASAQALDHSEISNFPDINKYNLQNTLERQQALDLLRSFYISQSGNTTNLVAVLVVVVVVVVVIVIPFAEKAVADSDSLLKKITTDRSITHEKLVDDLTSL